MEKSVFDGAAFVSIDLEAGRVTSVGRDRLAMVSTEILSMIPASDELTRAAAGWGEKHGRILADRMRSGVSDVEALSSHLGGTLAALGLGRVRVEIRHRALLFRLLRAGEPVSDGSMGLVAGFLSGYLSALLGKPFRVLDLGPRDADRLFFAGNPDAVMQVREGIGAGRSPLDAIDALMPGEISC